MEKAPLVFPKSLLVDKVNAELNSKLRIGDVLRDPGEDTLGVESNGKVCCPLFNSRCLSYLTFLSHLLTKHVTSCSC